MDGSDYGQNYHIFVNGELTGDFVAAYEKTEKVNAFSIKTSGGVETD